MKRHGQIQTWAKGTDAKILVIAGGPEFIGSVNKEMDAQGYKLTYAAADQLKMKKGKWVWRDGQEATHVEAESKYPYAITK